MKELQCTLTERGQVSVPASIRKELGLRPGQKMRWVLASDRECRVVFDQPKPQGPVAALGFRAKRLGGKNKTTKQWMSEIREAE